MFNLRPYQEEIARAVADAERRGRRRVLYQLPTGMGKTVTFAEICRRAAGRALVIAHREELLDQAARCFRKMIPGCQVDVEQGELRAHQGAEVICASVQTLARGDRLSWFKPGLVVVDECHHATAESYRQVFQRFGCFDVDGPLLVGCTATPTRLDGKKLFGTVFEEQVFSYSIRQGIEEGWLSDIRGWQVRTETDLRGIRSLAGDFHQGELQRRVDVEPRTEKVIEHWEEIARERPTIAFCTSVEHARHAAAAWRKAGYRAETIDGTLPSDERKAILDRFKSGRTQILTNVEVLTEGFDHPPLSCVVMLRPTQSWGLFAQMVGRGTRGGWRCPVPGKKDLLVLDVVDVCGSHDLATVPSLLGLPSGMDLQGQSLRDAARIVEQIGEKCPGLLDQLPLSFDELETTLVQADLFAKRPPKAEPDRQRPVPSRFAWAHMPGDALRLGCGNQRVARLFPDLLGDWHLRLEVGKQELWSLPLGETDRDQALAFADRLITQAWPDGSRIAVKTAKWRQDRPSEKQMDLLTRRCGHSLEEVSAMTKGEASEALDRHFAAQRDRKAAGGRS